MKVKELIAELLDNDPTGESEVCVGNEDIHFAEMLPVYYDGCLQRLVHDESKKPYYSIVGARYTDKGDKVSIIPLSISNALLDNPDLPVEFDVTSSRKHYEEVVERHRQEVRRIEQDHINNLFYNWAVSKLNCYDNGDYDKEEIEPIATKWAEENLRENDPVDENLHKEIVEVKTGNLKYPTIQVHLSWNDKRLRQWDKDIQIVFLDDGWFTFKRQ